MPHLRNTRMGAMFRGAFSLADVLRARLMQGSPRTLPTLLLFVTYRCNLNCAMCGVRHHPSDRELSSNEYVNILDAAQRLGTTLMLISGGEALSRGDLVYDVVRLGRERGIASHLCSNGLLINEDVARRLDASGLGSLSISLESDCREIHERIRGAGSFDHAVAALHAMRSSAPRVRMGINCTVSALNYQHLTGLIPLAESLGVQQLKFAPFHTNLLHSEKPSADFEPLHFSETELQNVESEMARVFTAVNDSKLLTNHPRYQKEFASSFSQSPAFRCYAGFAACTIDPFGHVSPCPDHDTGLSVREAPLDTLWRSTAYQELRMRVCDCGVGCWDPLYTELSLRLAPGSLWRSIREYLRDFRFYYGQ